MYRDFLYLDMDRIQSILAQLQEGVLKEVVTGKTKELSGDATIAAGILSKLMPLSLEGSVGYQSSTQSSKILHDYAFTLARETLRDRSLLIKVEDWDRDELPLPAAAFVELEGSASVLDYELIGRLADNEDTLSLLGLGSLNTPPDVIQRTAGSKNPRGKKPQNTSSSKGPLQQMKGFIDLFWGNSLQIRFQHESGLLFVGPLARSFLREESRSFIFKFGSGSQAGWNMFAQISAIPEARNRLTQLPSSISELQDQFSLQKSNMSSLVDLVDAVLEIIQTVQAAAASVSYPAIAVTPIAVYRELQSLR